MPVSSGSPQPLDLGVGEAPGLDAADALALQEFVEQFHQGQDHCPRLFLIVLIQIDPGGLAAGDRLENRRLLA